MAAMMARDLVVRRETPEDRAAVRRLLIGAFPSQAEADLVDALRAQNDRVLALVAVCAGDVVGAVMYSKLQAPFAAVALAPIAVLIDHRRRGIGATLIEAGFAALQRMGVEAVFVLGDPGYYARFGFDAAAAAGFASPYAGPYFMMRTLTCRPHPATTGAVVHAPAFAQLAG